MDRGVEIVSILWFVGTITACICGCHRFRVINRKVKALEEKVQTLKNPPITYTIPVSSAPYIQPSAPSYVTPKL